MGVCNLTCNKNNKWYHRNNRLRNFTFWSHPNLKVLNVCNNRLNDIMEIKKLDFPALKSISIKGNVMNRDKWHRYYLILQFSQMAEINEERVNDMEKMRSEAYRQKFQNDEQTIGMSMDAVTTTADNELLLSTATVNQAIVKINSLQLNLG